MVARHICDLGRYGEAAGEGPGIEIPIKLSQAELASWIGTCRETVDCALRRWRDRGIIATRYRTVIINDRQALARIAGVRITSRRPPRDSSSPRLILGELDLDQAKRRPQVGCGPGCRGSGRTGGWCGGPSLTGGRGADPPNPALKVPAVRVLAVVWVCHGPRTGRLLLAFCGFGHVRPLGPLG